MAEILRSSLEYGFEGIDGGGKTTNIKRLTEYYMQKGYRIVVLSGLSNTDFGLEIRRNIARYNAMGVEGMWYFKEDIKRSYASLNGDRGVDILLWDRHVYSIFAANQAPDCSMETIRQAKPVIPEPPRVFLLNVDPDLAWNRERLIAKGDHPITPQWLREKHIRYVTLAKLEPHRFQSIDASKPIDEVFAELVGIIDQDLEKRRTA